MDIGMSELLLIGIVALIVIGPRDLPEMFRQLGRMTAKLRSMSREFSRAMEQAANEAGVKDVAKDLKSITSPKAMGMNAVKDAVEKFEKWDPIKNAAKPTSSAAVGVKPLVPPPMPATPAPVVKAEVVKAEVAEGAADGAAKPAYDKLALRSQVLAEQTAKLKAIEAGTYQPEPQILPPGQTPKTAIAKPAEPPVAKPAKPRATKPKPAETVAADKPAPKPRKTKKVEQT